MTRLDVSLARLLAVAPPDGDWWLIGSAAAYLCGIDLKPQDVDVVASKVTISAFADALGGEATPAGSDLFRSTPFVRIDIIDGLPIELMGDLHVHRGDWVPLRLTTRIAVETQVGTVYVPSLEEQAAVFERSAVRKM